MSVGWIERRRVLDRKKQKDGLTDRKMERVGRLEKKEKVGRLERESEGVPLERVE